MYWFASGQFIIEKQEKEAFHDLLGMLQLTT